MGEIIIPKWAVLNQAVQNRMVLFWQDERTGKATCAQKIRQQKGMGFKYKAVFTSVAYVYVSSLCKVNCSSVPKGFRLFASPVI